MVIDCSANIKNNHGSGRRCLTGVSSCGSMSAAVSCHLKQSMYTEPLVNNAVLMRSLEPRR